ncbi:7tm 7 domain containing protein [Asbolus verrucosus]|uniref:Gustatory receptor n=1 Tax=Asbolus verrucosus TaxID=1661398 RepID=A0A482VXL0_ASBVE|nr:7tm 7 domain containing protein [Asbolus verrucosus]
MVRVRSINNFYESLLPIFIFSTIVGVFPMFPTRINGKYALYTSKRLHSITALLLIIYSSCFLTTILRKSNNVVGQKFYKKRNKVSNFGLTFEFIFGIIVLYTIYFMSFKQTKHVREVMINLKHVDDMLKKLKQKFEYVRSVWYQLIIIFSGLMMVTLIASMQIYNIRIEKFPPLSLHMWILFLYPMVTLYDMISQYSITSILIYERFKMVNQQLAKIKYDLETTSLAHEFFLSLYAVFYYYWMFSQKQAEIVGRQIHKILINTRIHEIEEKLLMFSQQVMHSKFKFTLCGLFNIDASLLFNMIGSSTTFIVIMIQFQETMSPTIICVHNRTLNIH